MEDLDKLSKLLDLLKLKGINYYKTQGLELGFFHTHDPQEIPRQHIPTQDHAIEVPIDEKTLPPDLRTDAITNADTVLHWSTHGEPEQDIPGTGDEPLQ